MMNETRLKYIFYIASASLLILMLFLSKNAGISCDEVLHYDHSVSVYNYFASHGSDKSALNTPVTNLKYYGQSYDDITTFLIKWFKIEDAYKFRHLSSSFAGWLTIFITGLFAACLSGYGTGILVIILFVVSPTFFGHAQNNLKDVPFALAYISSIFFFLKFLKHKKGIDYLNLSLSALAISFAISIRAGGLVLICYSFLFLFISFLYRYFIENNRDFSEFRTRFLILAGFSAVAWFLSILIWPYGLQAPVKNVIESYKVMAHFPSTFRQIFEGTVQWSDQMPWYYLPKSMFVTIPLVVLSGLVLFILSFRIKHDARIHVYAIIIFTILFPLIFVVLVKSNVYSSWRQFLFVYPGIVLISASGYFNFYKILPKRIMKWGIPVIVLFLCIHPLNFMFKNPEFYYLYYNQMTGGLKGAYGNYETDYYYISQTSASEWLINYLKNDEIREKTVDKVKVKATYSVNWQFRHHPEIETSYFRWEERSMSDWDYAIVTNRYISPYKLKNKLWPPADALHIIYADDVPLCAVVKRKTRDDYFGYAALNEGKNEEAATYFGNAVKIDDSDEMIFYNFAAASFNMGKYQKADSLLKKGLQVNPDFEPILMYLGNIAWSQNKRDEALGYYERVIKVNRKYFDAYVSAAELYIERDVEKSRSLLRECLGMNPKYAPAIIAMADTYRKTHPDIAKKYDELAKSME